MSLTEKQQIEITRELTSAIAALMSGANENLDRKIKSMIARSDAGALQLDLELAELFRAANTAETVFIGAVSRAVLSGHQSTLATALARFAEIDLPRLTREIDIKAVNAIIKKAVDSYRAANAAGKASAELYFRVAANSGAPSDLEILEMLARGLIDRKSSREVARFLSSELSRGQIFDPARLSSYKSRVMRDFKRELTRNPNLSEALRAAHLAKKRASLENGRFLQIITRKGGIRTYRADTYALMVARTEIGNAQCQGEIDAAGQYGLVAFQVTIHNTTTEICKPHEGQIYVTEKRGPLAARYGQLTARTTPTYHTNCRHRLIAVPFPEEIAA